MSAHYIVITGPTATGKTHRAVSLANLIGGEIISADSRQVFRGMDIGTGKDLNEYGSTPHHLIDIRPAGYKYNLFEFLNDERHARTQIRKNGNVPILCGGTGLYIENVLRGTFLPEVPENTALRNSLKGKTLTELGEMLAGMKPLHNVTDLDTAQRAIRAIEIEQFYIDNPALAAKAKQPQPLDNYLIIGIDIPVEKRRERITRRLHQRLAEGMIEETRNLLDNGVDPQALINYGLEYKFLTKHLLGEITLYEMVSALETAIHQFAKRQMTWFRGMERRGFKINWLPFNLTEDEFNSRVIMLMNHDA